MSFMSTFEMSKSASLIGRLQVCAHLAGKTVSGLAGTSDQWVINNLLTIVSTTGWDTAWNGSTATDPGADPTAITDTMIQSAVSALA